MSTENCIRNRYPMKGLDGKRPFEVWMDKTSNVSEFRDFGCKVFRLNLEPSSKGKFDLICKEGKFLGYSDEIKGFQN